MNWEIKNSDWKVTKHLKRISGGVGNLGKTWLKTGDEGNESVLNMIDITECYRCNERLKAKTERSTTCLKHPSTLCT